jgi:hypothetical protein
VLPEVSGTLHTDCVHKKRAIEANCGPRSSSQPQASNHDRRRRAVLGLRRPPRNHDPHRSGRRSIAAVIPAFAGNTASQHRTWRRNSGSSPHARGTRALSVSGILFGSFPHARGTHPARVNGETLERSIPACAGNTSCPGKWRNPRTVHPSIRGEYSSSVFLSIWSSGSSPHAWGTRSDDRLGRSPRRFIPACAGNTPRKEY